MIDVSILRRSSQDRVRKIAPWDGKETISVMYCGPEEMKQVRALAKELMRDGIGSDDAYSVAYGRVCLVGWEGFFDGDKPLEFNRENVELLMLGSTEIRTAVINGATSLKAGAEKN